MAWLISYGLEHRHSHKFRWLGKVLAIQYNLLERLWKIQVHMIAAQF